MSTDLAGKTFVITGANTGIGRVTATDLARRGAHVIVACRTPSKAQPVIDAIRKETGNDRVELITLDLGDQTSVRSAAAAILAKNVPIHGLINNAGLAARGTTKEGFELTFGTNHLGHYLFTRLLLDRLKEAGTARIVNVSSNSHYRAKAIDFDAQQKTTKSVTAVPEYEVSKLSNVLFTKELARRLEGTGITTYAVHPGVVATDVWRRVPLPLRWIAKRFMLTPEQGAKSTIVAATDPALASHTGRYYTASGKERTPNRLSEDPELARTLWNRSAEWTGLPA